MVHVLREESRSYHLTEIIRRINRLLAIKKPNDFRQSIYAQLYDVEFDGGCQFDSQVKLNTGPRGWKHAN